MNLPTLLEPFLELGFIPNVLFHTFLISYSILSCCFYSSSVLRYVLNLKSLNCIHFLACLFMFIILLGIYLLVVGGCTAWLPNYYFTFLQYFYCDSNMVSVIVLFLLHKFKY